MGKLDETKIMLKAFGLPTKQQNDRSAWTLLAVLNLKENDSWADARQRCIKIHDIMNFIATYYGFRYQENSRETIRRQTLHQFNHALITEINPDNPKRPTNSPDTVYAITDEALDVIRKYGTEDWDEALSNFIVQNGTLQEKYDKKKASGKIKLQLPNGSKVALSSGKHNELQANVIRVLLPRFFPNAQVIYLGDTAHKLLTMDKAKLQELNVPITEHDKLPDIVLYNPSKNTLILIEVVTSHGPVTPKRQLELEKVLSEWKAKKIYISAFPNFTTLKKYLDDIAWETEIWLADKPEHMIHFNGDKFLNA